MNKKLTQQWLEILSAQLSDIDSALLMMPDDQRNKLVVMAKWPENLENNEDFSRVVKYTLKKRSPVCLPQSDDTEQEAFDLFAQPIFIESKLVGILTIRTSSLPKDKQKRVQNWLKNSTRWLKLASPSHARHDDFYSSVVALLASCLEQNNYRQSLISMVTEITQLFNCERVAYAEFKGHYSQVVALSNSASFDHRSNLMQKVADAMDEAIEQDNAIVFPNPNGKIIQRAHQELSRKFGYGTILTIPMAADDRVIGAICLLRNEETPFTQQTSQLCQQAFSLLAPYLLLKQEQERPLIFKIGHTIKQQLQSWFGLQHLKLKLGVLSAVLLIALSSLIQGDFRVSADAILEGRIQRVVNAPLSGYLLSASVRAGDTVRQGDVMASLNDAEIKLQLTKLSGELQKARREYREAQSTRNLVKVRVIDQQIKEIQAELELAQQQLERINLTAPFDGVVIEGDLEQLLGAPVERGDTLFKIAPLEDYRIILKVDESQIARIEPGQNGSLILPSLAERTFPLTVEKITAASVAEDGANIFRVEASLNEQTDQLRPGMQGVGKIDAGSASLLWIWTHAITDRLRLWLWSWLP